MAEQEAFNFKVVGSFPTRPNMTQLFTVIYDYGQYSDRDTSILGAFSTKEKAQQHIEKICAKFGILRASQLG